LWILIRSDAPSADSFFYTQDALKKLKFYSVPSGLEEEKKKDLPLMTAWRLADKVRFSFVFFCRVFYFSIRFNLTS
jgi:hypothetical protein